MHVRVALLEPAEHLAVVGEPRLHVEAAHDVELAHVVVRGGLGERLLHRVAIGALFLGQAGVGAEDARLAQDADVRRVDVLVGGKVHAIAVSRAVGRVGEHAEAVQVGRGEERGGVGGVEPLTALHALGDRAECRIAQSCPVDPFDGGWHAITSRSA